MQLNSKLNRKLDQILNNNLSKIIADSEEVLISSKSIKSVKAGNISIETSDFQILFELFEQPHHWGRTNLEIDVQPNEVFRSSLGINEISEIRFYFNNPMFRFSKTKYLLQVEIITNNLSLSIGQYYFDNNQFNFLYTGEMAITTNIILCAENCADYYRLENLKN